MGMRNLILGIGKVFGSGELTSYDVQVTIGYRTLKQASAQLSRAYRFGLLKRRKNPSKNKQYIYKLSERGVKYYWWTKKEMESFQQTLILMKWWNRFKAAINNKDFVQMQNLMKEKERMDLVENVDKKWL